MITDAVLEQGVVRGIVTNEQVASLRTLARDMAAQAAPEPEDDEKLRFITGFNDIFVTIGIGLFTLAIYYLGEKLADKGIAAMALIGSSWLLAEFFTRRRRMALPSIVLLCIFAASVFLGGKSLVTLWFGHQEMGKTGNDNLIMIPALVTALMAGLHYYRFRVPITVAVGVGALIGVVVIAAIANVPQISRDYLHFVVAFAGLAVFALAMRFDLSDPSRVTRRTDIAFWLHMLAAPLIVHPLILPIMGDKNILTLGVAGAVLAIFAALGIVAVIIDRRALLVSGLVYAGYASAKLIEQIGLGDQTLPATLLTLGAFVLLLSAGWRPVRTALLRLLPAHLAQRLPHPILSSS